MPGLNLKLVGDITCLPTAEGWLYLATVIDLCTPEAVGWSMAGHMRAELVADAIRMAHAGGHTAGNAIFHSDRGSQSTSRQFRGVLAELDIRRSVGRTGSCFDDAAAESFFAVLKAEIGTTVWGPGPGLGRTCSGGSRNITTESESTRSSATSRRTRRGPASPTAGPRGIT